MKNFKILSRICSDSEELSTILSAYCNFHNNITNKHQKRVQLVLIDTPQMRKFFSLYSLSIELRSSIHFIKKTDTEVIQECDLFLIVGEKNILPCIEFAFKNNLPIMSYLGITQRRVLNSGSSILIPFENKLNSPLSISNMLKMLYFDPYAQNFLKKGVKEKSAQYFKKLRKKNQYETARSVA